MILYFSATGNSAYAAKYLAELLHDPEIYSLTPYIREKKSPHFLSKKPYVILAPVYISSLPGIVEELLKRSTFSGNKKVYFVMTCAGNKSASGYFARKLCGEKGLRYMGTAHLSMPQDYLIYFKTMLQAANEEKIAEAMKNVPALAKRIRAGKRLKEKKPGRLHVLVIKPVAALFLRLFIRPGKFYADENCVSCGLCKKVCPLGNITMRGGRPVWGKNCIHCTACINRCPKQAIEYGKLTKDRLRYAAPEYGKK